MFVGSRVFSLKTKVQPPMMCRNKQFAQFSVFLRESFLGGKEIK